MSLEHLNNFLAFSQIPSSQVVSIGEEAVFQCRHPTADLTDWIVNGSLVGSNPPPDVLPGAFQTDHGTVVNTLTIVGRPEYNGTVVVCEAYFREGPRSELSPEAWLVLEHNTSRPPPGGKIINLYSLFVYVTVLMYRALISLSLNFVDSCLYSFR